MLWTLGTRCSIFQATLALGPRYAGMADRLEARELESKTEHKCRGGLTDWSEGSAMLNCTLVGTSPIWPGAVIAWRAVTWTKDPQNCKYVVLPLLER